MFENFQDMLFEYGIRFVITIAIIIVGFWLTKYVLKLLERALVRSQLDVSIHGFVKSISSFFIKMVVVITAVSVLGVNVTTFIALLSAAGLAVGLALKDSMSNFAAGVLLLLFKPFTVGDFIDAGGSMGTVQEITLLYTRMNTVDNKLVLVPNGELTTSRITNFSVEPLRRLDKVFGVGYGSDLRKVKMILTDIVESHPLILKDKPSIIRLTQQNDSSLDFDVKVWVKREDLFTVSYDLNESVLEQFTKNGIEIPFPQTDVHLHQVEK